MLRRINKVWKRQQGMETSTRCGNVNKISENQQDGKLQQSGEVSTTGKGVGVQLLLVVTMQRSWVESSL